MGTKKAMLERTDVASMLPESVVLSGDVSPLHWGTATCVGVVSVSCWPSLGQARDLAGSASERSPPLRAA
jgi:hypothetical protein